MRRERSRIENSRDVLIELDEKSGAMLKDTLLEMCNEIFIFCSENNLCCMLGGGSALGAVRHNGFIPWDDDLDLNMPRKDYLKFIKLFSEQKSEKYELFVPDGNHRISNLFMKISLKGTIAEDVYSAGASIKTGISIDVFPIENVPNNWLHARYKAAIANIFAFSAVSCYMFQNRNESMKRIHCSGTINTLNYIIRCIIGFSMSFKNYEYWYCKFDKWVQFCGETKKCTIPTGRKHYDKEMHACSVFFPPVKHKFEQYFFNIPHDVDKYLKTLYGNYMEIPPIEKREMHLYTKIEFLNIGKTE